VSWVYELSIKINLSEIAETSVFFEKKTFIQCNDLASFAYLIHTTYYPRQAGIFFKIRTEAQGENLIIPAFARFLMLAPPYFV
jgi:hypothetical protein